VPEGYKEVDMKNFT